MEYESITPNYWIKNQQQCSEKFKDDNNWNSIPSVNTKELHNLKDNCLVRFHGMIQDMYNPEYYLEKYEVENEVTKERSIKCGKYRDTTDLESCEIINFNSIQNVTSERQTLVVITLPGLNEWVYQIDKGNNKDEPIISESANQSHKRPIEEESMETDTSNSGENSACKKVCTAEKKKESTSVVSREHILNFPLPDCEGKCCHAKIYENTDNFKLNDMVDILGFLSVDPMLTGSNYHNNEHDNEMEIKTHNPPPSLVPRIHCVLFKKYMYYNPLVKNITLQNDMIMNLNKELSIVLTQLLFGDKLAADYLICHLISSVYLRKDLLAIGKFALNLSNIPESQSEYGKQLYEFLQLLVPKSYYLPLSLNNMNELSFTPKKDYECNRLTSGILQLSNNTHLILDETKLQPGRLNSSGCKGIAALAATIQVQKVNYDFNYYQMEFDCDIPIIILSEGASLLPCDVHVPLQPDDQCLNTYPEILDAAKHFLKPELLNQIRVYLTQMRHTTYTLSDDVLDLVQKEFVKLRQNDSKIGADDLHQLLVLARLICLSQGKNTLNSECWQLACKMEEERKIRIANRPTRK